MFFSSLNKLSSDLFSSRSLELQKRDHILLLELVRLSLLFFLFSLLMVKFFSQKHFINTDHFFSVYSLLSLSFCLHLFYLIGFERLFSNKNLNRFLFFYEILFISFMAYFLKVNPSLYLFMYLINLFFCGFILGKREVFLFACLTSFFFHAVLLFFPSMPQGTFVFIVLMNNLAFFFSGVVSGYFAEEIDWMKKKIREGGRRLWALRNLNQIIVENIDSGLMTVTGEGEILYANAKAEILFSHRGLRGKRLAESLPDLDHLLKRWKLSISSSLISHPSSYEIKHTFTSKKKQKGDLERPSSKESIIEVRVSSFFDPSQELKGYLFLIQDRTEMKKLEVLLREKEKMAAIGQLASGIAHEIRNPLAGISGSLQMIFEEKGKEAFSSSLSEENQKLSQIVFKEMDRLNELVSEFLDYAKSEEYPLTPLHLNSLIKDMLESLSRDSALSFSVKQDIHLEEECKILGHENKLKQVFLNLFINAFQALKGRPSPLLTVSAVKSERENEVHVQISDNGSGMKEDTLKCIFEPFYSTKEKGSGLGLSLVYKILEKHKAQVQVDSQLDQGTSFVLRFPLLKE